jgi:predicted DNA-binding transcriptional regulator AlpA
MTMENRNAKRLLSPNEVAHVLGVKPKTLAEWRVSGAVDLKYCKIGASVRYRSEDLEALIGKSMFSHTGGYQNV